MYNCSSDFLLQDFFVGWTNSFVYVWFNDSFSFTFNLFTPFGRVWVQHGSGTIFGIHLFVNFGKFRIVHEFGMNLWETSPIMKFGIWILNWLSSPPRIYWVYDSPPYPTRTPNSLPGGGMDIFFHYFYIEYPPIPKICSGDCLWQL